MPEPTLPACQVLVVDKDFRPLSGVELKTWGDARSTRSGKSDEHGLCSVTLPEGPSLHIEGSLEGYSQERVSLLAPFPSQVTLVLEAGVSVSGVVRDEQGRPLGANCRVLFVLLGSPGPPAGVLDSALRNEPAPGVAYTDPSGQYTVSGLRSGRSYSTYAALDGWASSSKGLPVVAQGQGNHDLIVMPIYAVSLRLIDSQTKVAFARSSNALHGFELLVRINRTELQPFLLPPDSLGFFIGAKPPKDSETDCVEYFLGAPGVTRAAVPVSVHTQFVGYQPWSGTLDAARLDAGFKIHALELVRNCDGFGRLSLTLPDALRTPRNQQGAHGAALELHSTIQDTLTYPLDLSSDRPQTFDAIPWGSYSVLVSAEAGSLMHPGPGAEPWIVRITEEPVALTLPRMDVGSLLITPRMPDESAFCGQLEVIVLEGKHPRESLGKGHKALGRKLSFLGPPYRIEWRVPGIHTVVLVEPKSHEVSVFGEVRSGQTTELSFSLK